MPRGTYNFDFTDIEDRNFKALYEARRRDSIFAFTIEEPHGGAVLGRDHLGAVPLYWRPKAGRVESSIFFEDLLDGDETASAEGVATYLSLGTNKVTSLVNEIRCVPPGSVIHASPTGDVELLYQYRITAAPSTWNTFTQNVDALDALLVQATQRTLKTPTVGLYLSGGIDSGLTGHYVRHAGARVRAYTAHPWGAASKEATLAIENATAIGAETHYQYSLETDSYGTYIEDASALYGNLCGATSQIAILALLTNTPVLEEEQVYFAQNADTASASVADQSLLYFVSFLPRFLMRRVHRMLKGPTLADSYAAFRTVGFVRRSPIARRLQGYGRLAVLTISGMLFAHTPVDGDIVLLPHIRKGTRVSNLYYDMDVVEFLLGTPLRHRLEWSAESKIGLALGKRLLRALALRHLPPGVVARKKGLAVPAGRDHATRTFFSALPTHVGTHTLTLPHHRFAAEMLRRYIGQLKNRPAALTALFARHE